jgi:hypothetical protein
MLGNGRLEAQCIDGVKRLCHIRGKMRKKVWVNTVSSHPGPIEPQNLGSLWKSTFSANLLLSLALDHILFFLWPHYAIGIFL